MILGHILNGYIKIKRDTMIEWVNGMDRVLVISFVFYWLSIGGVIYIIDHGKKLAWVLGFGYSVAILWGYYFGTLDIIIEDNDERGIKTSILDLRIIIPIFAPVVAFIIGTLARFKFLIETDEKEKIWAISFIIILFIIETFPPSDILVKLLEKIL